MKASITQTRQIENEMIFRKDNEKITKSIEEVDALQKKQGNLDLLHDDNTVLYFKCECSDENCTERIPVKISTYQKIHQNRHKFIIKPKHQVNAIETVIKKKEKYNVVHKDKMVPLPKHGLNQTTINNVGKS